MTATLVEFPTSFHKRECFRSVISTNMEVDIDAKELADRMAAAEAMSALSSVVRVNPGDSPASPRTSKRIASRGTRGGGRGRGRKTNQGDKIPNTEAKKSRSRARTNHDTTKSNVTDSARNKPTRAASKSKASAQEQAPKRSPRRKSKSGQSEPETPTKTRTKRKNSSAEYGEMPVLEPQVTNASSTVSNIPSLPSTLSLTLPSLNIPSLGTLPTLGSIPIFHPDTNSGDKTKQDNKSLPFKKRRLINNEHGEDSEDQESKTEGAQTQEQGPSTSSQTPSVQIDPSQHFRLFQEIQAALTADEDGDVPLHLAVVHEHIPLVQKFIQLMKIARKSVDRFNKDKQTPLHLAVKLNFLGGVKALLDAGADVNFVDKTGCTSLHLAVKHQLPECLRLLVSGTKEKADFNTRNFEGLTPLHTAVELKNKSLLIFILDHGADINMMDGKSGRTPMFHAAENNEIEMVELLLKRGGNPDVLNYAGSTAIMAAQARNFNQITKMLSRASEWNDEEGSGTSSPASEVSVYVPDPGVGVWKHSVPLRNPATTQKSTTQAAQTFSRASSSVADNEVSLAQTCALKPSETVPRVTVSNNIMDKTVVMEKRSSEMSRTVSRSPKVNAVTGDDVKEKEQEKGNSNNSAQPVERTPSLRSTELSMVDISKFPPQLVQNMMQKIMAAKQQMISSSGRGSNSVQKADSDVIASRSNSTVSLTKVSSANQIVTSSPGSVTCHGPASSHQTVTSHPSVMSHSSVVSHPAVASRLSVTSQVPVVCHPSTTSHTTSHLPLASRSPVFSHAVGIVNSHPNVTSHSARIAHPAVTTHQISRQNVTPSPPSTTSHHVAPSTQIVGKVSQVIEKLPQQPERIISTGMVVEHPEFGLVFRPFSAGPIHKVNQPEAAPKTLPPSSAMRLAELPMQESQNVSEKNTSEKIVKKTKSQTNENATTLSARKSGNGDTKVTSSISDVISSAKEQPSHPVTEKLLNSKPKSTPIPKSRPESQTKSLPGPPAADTNQVKSIANSAIAAKLRQRVLNSPHVDSATKALLTPTVAVTTTTHSSETVTTAPERVPKLPQFSSRPLNIAPNSTTFSTEPRKSGVSKILEHLSKPIDSYTSERARLNIDGSKLNSDGSDQNTDGGRKNEKKKRKAPGAEMKKKTLFIKEESDEKTSSRLDSPVNVT